MVWLKRSGSCGFCFGGGGVVVFVGVVLLADCVFASCLRRPLRLYGRHPLLVRRKRTFDCVKGRRIPNPHAPFVFVE